MFKFKNLGDIESLLEKNESYRNECINLIASENYPSRTVRRFQDSELLNRYGCYTTMHLDDREYTGNKYIYEMEYATQELAKEVFKAEYVDFRPLGGHMAGMATVFALTPPGGLVVEMHMKDWGHGLVDPTCKGIPHVNQTIHVDFFDFNKNRKLKLDGLDKIIKEKKPQLVILGGSGMLFPEPIAEIKKICTETGTWLAHDSSHVSGLIASGLFPNPLEEGADVVFCSTHKSFPGPQGGMILTNNAGVMKKIGNVLAPGMVTSHHVHRLPSLAAALLEIREFGFEYSNQVVKNAQSLAKALDDRGLPILAKDEGYTKTHLLLADVKRYGHSQVVAKSLEKANIFVSDDFGQLGKEIRIGTPEITRRGMKIEHMPLIADFIKRVIVDREVPEIVGSEVKKFATSFKGCAYTFLEN